MRSRGRYALKPVRSNCLVLVHRPRSLRGFASRRLAGVLTLTGETLSTELVRAPNRVPTLPDPDRIRAIAAILFSGGMCNKHMNKIDALAARIIAGYEVGLSPVQSVNWIAVINGRAVIWGDAALALVRASGILEGDITERYEGEGDDRVAVCITKRKGATEPRETRFSVADAKKADLWNKEGPWTQYPERQLMWRARGWNLRDNFNDVLCGLGIAEEELDVPVKVVAVKADLPATLPPSRSSLTTVNRTTSFRVGSSFCIPTTTRQMMTRPASGKGMRCKSALVEMRSGASAAFARFALALSANV